MAPAETYKLNTLASVLGRYAVPHLTKETVDQTNSMFETAVDDIRRYDVPEVPHNNEALLGEAAKFDRKLSRQLEEGPASRYLTESQRKMARAVLQRHEEYCNRGLEGGASWQSFITPDSIATAYGLPNLWEDPNRVICEEIEKWGYETIHPVVPSALRKKVSLDTTNSLMSLMWREIIGLSEDPEVHTYLTDDVKNYHVFWTPLAGKLDYATPRDYSIATQLSFDLPHNATHLAHLSAMDKSSGAARYDDSMALRAYFESATVLSEKKTVEVVEGNHEFSEEVADIIGATEMMAAIALGEWIAQDRKYEFKLRAARYAGDVLMMQGVGFEDAVNEVSERFGITLTDAANEVRKYLPWTGLGAVYTRGYRQLESEGVKNVIDVIVGSNGEAITTWHDFLRLKSSS